MADEDGKTADTDKQHEEASKAGSKPGSARSKPGSAKSKPGSAKSKPGSAKSAAGSTQPGSAKTPKSKASARVPSGKAKKGKGKKKDEEKKEKKEEDEGLPEGCLPLFLSSKTQEIFNCVGDEDVTQDEPRKFIKKEDVDKDLFNRAAISDFYPVKQIIMDFPEDEILIVYDPDFKYGQNFFLCTTLDSKQKILHRAGLWFPEEEGGPEEEDEFDDENLVLTYVPPEPKEWQSFGSEIEIEEESVADHRERIRMTIRRVRRHFGTPVEFEDRNVADAKDAYIECTAFEDKTFDLKRLELNKAIQAVPELVESSSQTTWRFPRNACTQYEPRVFTAQEVKEKEESKDLVNFVNGVIPRFELAMQQNDIMDIFYNDWLGLADDESSFGSKADSHLKEYQSFTDLLYSKQKTITDVQWHPSIRGVVAVSIAEKMSFDDRIDNAARVIMTPSLILVWSFLDPIHPQLLLESPDDINCFRFSPTDANIIAGGCVNGQVVLWDISAFEEQLKSQRGGNKRKGANSLPGFDDESSMETKVVRYCAVSSIENSHRSPVTDILWVPDHMEINRMGIPQENKTGQCCQIITSATDQSLLLWDTRPPKTAQQQGADKKKDQMKNPMNVPTTFKHLDLTWKPLLKISLTKTEPGGDHNPTKFSIYEVQGDRSIWEKQAISTTPTEDGSESVSKLDNESEKKDTSANMGYGKPGSAKRTLSSVNTHIYVGTEDGELVYVDWVPQKDADSGKVQTPKPDYYQVRHDGPVVSLCRSPFFRDILLVIGGWTFTIWKEGVSSGPILESNANNKRLTAGQWSVSRPGVFYIAKQDGSVDVWDLLDRTHEPSMNQSVSPLPVTTLSCYASSSKQHFMAVGDSGGTLHILEIPWSLRHPSHNEETGVSNYFEREVKRREFVMERWNFREKEKMENESENKKKAGIAPNVQLSDEEILSRMQQEYQKYLNEESIFLRTLGLLKEEKEEDSDPS